MRTEDGSEEEQKVQAVQEKPKKMKEEAKVTQAAKEPKEVV